MLRQEDISGLLRQERSQYKDPYALIKTATIAADSRLFSKPKPSLSDSLSLLSKIVFLLNHGQRFSDNEKTEVFFNVTKLFSTEHERLRRLLYVFIKELNAKQTEALIVISSLTKDVNSKVPLFRSNALRALARVIDPEAHLAAVERFVRNALTEPDPSVANAALLFGIKLAEDHPGVVTRWAPDLQEKLNSSKTVFLALLLFLRLKQNDLLSIVQVLINLATTRQHRKILLRNKLAFAQLVRTITQVLKDAATSTTGYSVIDDQTKAALLAHLQGLLTQNHDPLVVFETSRSLVDLYTYYPQEVKLQAVFVALQPCLNLKTVSQFAALRLMNRIARQHPQLVSMASPDLEILISSENRFVASLAVSTLLQTCDEKSVEGLLQQISSYLEDMGEDFVIEVVQCIKALVHRMPRKVETFVAFLGKLVSPPFSSTDSSRAKEACVEAIHSIAKTQPSAAYAAMIALSDFIEDCTSVTLSCSVLQILAQEIPKLSHKPGHRDTGVFVHAIYNRVILEKSPVRAAAVSALARIARSVEDPELRESIRSLLKSCKKDPDDELRERSLLLSDALSFLEKQDTAPSSDQESTEIKELYSFALGERTIDVHALEERLVKALAEPDLAAPIPAIISDLEVDTKDAIAMASLSRKNRTGSEGQDLPAPPAGQPSQEEKKQRGDDKSGDQMYAQNAREKAALQAFLKSQTYSKLDEAEINFSSKEITVSEKDGEYHVSVIKHVLFAHDTIVLQYLVSNTLPSHVRYPFHSQVLKSIHIEAALKEGGAGLAVGDIEKPPKDFQLTPSNSPVYVYVQMRSKTPLSQATQLPIASLTNDLHIKISEDGSGFYGDHYTLSELLLTAADYLEPVPLRSGQFAQFWDLAKTRNFAQAAQSFVFESMRTIAEAVAKVKAVLGMAVCDGSDAVAAGAKGVRVALSGRFLGKAATLVQVMIWSNEENKIMLQISVRAQAEQAVRTLLESIQ